MVRTRRSGAGAVALSGPCARAGIETRQQHTAAQTLRVMTSPFPVTLAMAIARDERESSFTTSMPAVSRPERTAEPRVLSSSGKLSLLGAGAAEGTYHSDGRLVDRREMARAARRVRPDRIER